MKNDFIEIYEELNKLNESHVDPADYWNEPWELAKLPEYIFQQAGINKSEYVRRAWAAYYAKKNKAANEKTINSIENNKDYVVSNSIDETAAKDFWEAAKKWEINLEAFHKAFDEELEKLGAIGIFNSKGELIGKHSWSKIKLLDASNSAVRAVKKLWALSFTEPNYPKVDFKTTWLTPHIYKLERDVPDMAEWTIGYYVANSAEEAVSLAKIKNSDYDYIKDFGEALNGDREQIENFMATEYDHWYSEKEFFEAIGRKTSYCNYYDYCKINKILSLDGLVK